MPHTSSAHLLDEALRVLAADEYVECVSERGGMLDRAEVVAGRVVDAVAIREHASTVGERPEHKRIFDYRRDAVDRLLGGRRRVLTAAASGG